jgi:hypothetical protein
LRVSTMGQTTGQAPTKNELIHKYKNYKGTGALPSHQRFSREPTR